MSGERWVRWRGTRRVHWYANGHTLCGFMNRDFQTATPADLPQCATCRRVLDTSAALLGVGEPATA